MSGDFDGQFPRISNLFSEKKLFEGIELCAGAFARCKFSTKNISGNRLACTICKYLILFFIPQSIWRHFPSSWAMKPQSINFFPPNSWVFNQISFSIPVMGKRQTNTRLLGCNSRVVSSENSTFFQKLLGSKACSFAQTFPASRLLATT